MDEQKIIEPEQSPVPEQQQPAPERKKVGRPRKAGVERDESGRIKRTRKSGVLPEVSAARSAAGARGQAVLKRKHLLERERRKYGREFQAIFEPQLAAAKTEAANINPDLDPFYEIDHLLWACKNLIEGQGWNRTYLPTGYDNYNEENAWLDDQPEDLRPELQKSFGSYPEIDADMVVGYSTRINLEQLPLTKQLVIRALEAFLDFAKYQDARVMREIERTIPRVERALPKVKDGSIYNPPPLPEPQPPMSTEFFSDDGKPMWIEFHGKAYGNWADLHAAQASIYGPYYGPEVVVEDIKEKERKLQADREAQILANKELETRRKHDEERIRRERWEQNNLPSDALTFLRGYKQ